MRVDNGKSKADRERAAVFALLHEFGYESIGNGHWHKPGRVLLCSDIAVAHCTGQLRIFLETAERQSKGGLRI